MCIYFSHILVIANYQVTNFSRNNGNHKHEVLVNKIFFSLIREIKPSSFLTCNLWYCSLKPSEINSRQTVAKEGNQMLVLLSLLWSNTLDEHLERAGFSWLTIGEKQPCVPGSCQEAEGGGFLPAIPGEQRKDRKWGLDKSLQAQSQLPSSSS